MAKEKKLIFSLIFLFFMLLIFPTLVNATNITYKTEYYNSINTAIYVDGLDSNLENGYNYYIYVTQDNTIDTSNIISNAKLAKYDSLFYDKNTNQFYIKASSYFGIFEKPGNYYAYIVKGNLSETGMAGTNDSFSFIDGPTKLERPLLLKNGKRITASFNQNSTSYSISQYAHYTKMYGTDRKINFYLGKIEDESLLTKLSEKTSDAYDVLYNYAKGNNNYLYSGAFDTTSTGVLDYNIWKDYSGLKPGDYYFVYYKLDDENGTYVEMDDVQAYTVNNSGILDKLSTYISKEDTSTPQETNTNENDSTKANGTLPHAGVHMVIILAIALVVIISIFSYFKYNRIRNI